MESPREPIPCRRCLFRMEDVDLQCLAVQGKPSSRCQRCYKAHARCTPGEDGEEMQRLLQLRRRYRRHQARGNMEKADRYRDKAEDQAKLLIRGYERAREQALAGKILPTKLRPLGKTEEEEKENDDEGKQYEYDDGQNDDEQIYDEQNDEQNDEEEDEEDEEENEEENDEEVQETATARKTKTKKYPPGTLVMAAVLI